MDNSMDKDVDNDFDDLEFNDNESDEINIPNYITDERGYKYYSINVDATINTAYNKSHDNADYILYKCRSLEDFNFILNDTQHYFSDFRPKKESIRYIYYSHAVKKDILNPNVFPLNVNRFVDSDTIKSISEHSFNEFNKPPSPSPSSSPITSGSSTLINDPLYFPAILNWNSMINCNGSCNDNNNYNLSNIQKFINIIKLFCIKDVDHRLEDYFREKYFKKYINKYDDGKISYEQLCKLYDEMYVSFLDRINLRYCIICGKVYKTMDKNKHEIATCSQNCKRKFDTRSNVDNISEKKCLVCGEYYKSYSSDDIYKINENCDNKFTKLSTLSMLMKHTCSIRCIIKIMSTMMSGNGMLSCDPSNFQRINEEIELYNQVVDDVCKYLKV